MKPPPYPNFRDDILKAAGAESIEAIVIGGVEVWETGSHDDQPDGRKLPRKKLGVVLSWEDAAPLLNYRYDDGFGGRDCHPVWAWTPTRVLFVHEYDGATSVSWVPRHPQEGWPPMSGSSVDD